MKLGLGLLAALTLAFTGGLIALIAFGRCGNDANNLPCSLMLGMLAFALILGSALTAVALGIAMCRAASRSQRWGWFGVFLALTMSIAAAPSLILIILNVPLFQSIVNTIYSLVRAALILPPALAILTFIYLLAFAGTERGQTDPVSPPETSTSPPS